MVIEGVIRPPPEIRAVADKTASYVAKNGRAFEARILGSGKGKTPKFAFLHQSSPFHAYYEERIRFYENGGEDKKEDEEKKSDEGGEGDKAKNAAKEGESQEEKKEETKSTKKKDEKSQKSSAAIDPVAKALLAQRTKIAQARSKFNQEAEKEAPKTGDEQADTEQPVKTRKHYTPPAPPPLELVNIVAPSSLTISQVETIQLVAQFTALDGKGGPFFSKLSHREWANPAFAFTQPRHAHFAYFSALVDAYRHIYESWSVGSNPLKNDAIPECAGNVSRCLELVAYRVEYERDLEEQTRKHRAENSEIAEVAQIDWHDFVVVETIDFTADEKVELVLPPPPAPTSSNAAPNDQAAAGAQVNAGGDMDESDDEEGETIRVVPSYKPKVMSTKQSYSSDEVIDPITGKSVPIKDMPEHMRIQLLDPKWAEERKKFQEKQKDSNLVSGDMIASNISRFSNQSFGNAGHDLLSGETDSKRRLEEANRVIREQSQRGVGPNLPPPVQPGAGAPPPPPPPQHDQAHVADPGRAAAGEPAAKRQRLDDGAQDPRLAAPAETPQPTSGGMPMDPMANPAPPPSSGEKELIPGDEFIDTLSKPEVTLQVRIPNDPTQLAWNFYGQILNVTVDVKTKIKQVKEELAKSHLNDMPANKIQLKCPSGFLQNSKTLAELNIGPTATLELVPKTRGGRR